MSGPQPGPKTSQIVPDRAAHHSAIDRIVKCHVLQLAYNFEHKHGYLFVKEGNCCDMTGCLEVFKRIDPSVVSVWAHSGEHLDVSYHLTNGEWQARSYR